MERFLTWSLDTLEVFSFRVLRLLHDVGHNVTDLAPRKGIGQLRHQVDKSDEPIFFGIAEDFRWSPIRRLMLPGHTPPVCGLGDAEHLRCLPVGASAAFNCCFCSRNDARTFTLFLQDDLGHADIPLLQRQTLVSLVTFTFVPSHVANSRHKIGLWRWCLRIGLQTSRTARNHFKLEANINFCNKNFIRVHVGNFPSISCADPHYFLCSGLLYIHKPIGLTHSGTCTKVLSTGTGRDAHRKCWENFPGKNGKI